MPTLTERAQAIRDRTKAVPAGRLTLAQFAESGRTLHIYSDVLAEEVLFAADNAHIPEIETRVVYRARELAVVWGKDGTISNAALRVLHEAKKQFGGDVSKAAQNESVT